MTRVPWTHKELQELIPEMEKRLEETEAEQEEEVKPLPPMSVEECKTLLYRLMEYASERPLTARERFLHGQLLAQFQQAVMAEMLTKVKGGRFYCISEEMVQAELKRQR